MKNRDHVSRILTRGVTQVEKNAFAHSPDLLATLREKEAILWLAEQLDNLEKIVQNSNPNRFREWEKLS